MLGFGMGASVHRSYTVLWENSGISKNMSIPLWNFVLNAEHRKFLHSTSFVATYCQPTWALSVKNTTVLSRTKLTILATVDVRPTSLAMQFTVVSVHLFICARARRASPSAADGTVDDRWLFSLENDHNTSWSTADKPHAKFVVRKI